MKPEYQFARLECEHNPKIVLRSAQNADTIVKSADCQVQETSEIQKMFFNEVYVMPIPLTNFDLVCKCNQKPNISFNLC